MAITRRQALVSAGTAVLASSLAKPAIAAKEPIRMGYLPALTGPSSSTGIGINRGVQLAVDEINAAGGLDGRPIDLITRDTQSEPTKAVNGAAELAKGEKVSVVIGPVNSGELLAVVPLLARSNVPQVHPCWVDTLTDPKKYPMCFRNAPTNQQIGAAANRYVIDVLKRKKVAVISDTTGYGVASVNAYVPMLKDRARRWSIRAISTPPIRTSRPTSCASRPPARKPSCPGASMPASCPASSTPVGRWRGTCRSSARPRSAPARPGICWKSRNTGPRSIRTISARFAMPPAASCRIAPRRSSIA